MERNKRPSISDYFKYKNIRDYVQGTYNYYFKDNIETHRREQAFYRAYLCKPCLDNGKCMHCGCATPHLFFAPNKVDANGKWDKMLDAEEWETYKEENKIIIENIHSIVMNNIKAKNLEAKQMLEDQPLLSMYAPVPEYTKELKKKLENGTTEEDGEERNSALDNLGAN